MVDVGLHLDQRERASMNQHLSPEQAERRVRMSAAHRKGFDRFHARLSSFYTGGHLNPEQIEVVLEHLLRLGERGRNPANTGNIEDLFCHTLADTGDPIRAYAQALADSVKVVPMDPDASLLPAVRTVDGAQWYRAVGDLTEMAEPDRMLVTHTMVAYGDEEMWQSASDFVCATYPSYDEALVDREVARMAVQSQHLPSSSFVLARAKGLTLDCSKLWPRAGYSEEETRCAQTFYDICATFDPVWTDSFLDGIAPTSSDWRQWRSQYLAARDRLPHELIYQLSSDTLTNFLDGTLESGKWTDASVAFHGCARPQLLTGRDRAHRESIRGRARGSTRSTRR